MAITSLEWTSLQGPPKLLSMILLYNQYSGKGTIMWSNLKVRPSFPMIHQNNIFLVAWDRVSEVPSSRIRFRRSFRSNYLFSEPRIGIERLSPGTGGDWCAILSRTVPAVTFPDSRKWSGASASRCGISARLADARWPKLLLGRWGIKPFCFGFVALKRVSGLPFDFLLFNTHVLVY